MGNLEPLAVWPLVIVPEVLVKVEPGEENLGGQGLKATIR